MLKTEDLGPKAIPDLSIPLDRAIKELQNESFKSEIGQSQLELQTIKVIHQLIRNMYLSQSSIHWHGNEPDNAPVTSAGSHVERCATREGVSTSHMTSKFMQLLYKLQMTRASC